MTCVDIRLEMLAAGWVKYSLPWRLVFFDDGAGVIPSFCTDAAVPEDIPLGRIWPNCGSGRAASLAIRRSPWISFATVSCRL
jgi:hypothetical protein